MRHCHNSTPQSDAPGGLSRRRHRGGSHFHEWAGPNVRNAGARFGTIPSFTLKFFVKIFKEEFDAV